MGLSLHLLVVFFALAATFSLCFANHYHDGKRIDEVEIEGTVYCSSDGNMQSSSTRRLSRAKISLSCDEGETILYESTTKSDGEFEMKLKDQEKVDTVLYYLSKCAIFVHLPVYGCILAASDGYFWFPLDQNVRYVGSHAHMKTGPSRFVSCL